MSFLSNLVEKIQSENVHILDAGENSAEISGFIDTGSYAFNALLSGSLYGGLPDNRVTCFAGEEATGKTFFTLGVLSTFMREESDGVVSYFDTESAVSKKTFEEHGCDPARIAILEPASVEQFRTLGLQVLDHYLGDTGRPRMVMVLDSLGMLPSEKEQTDALAGNNVRDMTRSQAIRSAFRTLTLKLARAKTPLILTNHIYQTIGPISMKTVSGGGGVKYAASAIIMLSRKKAKEGEEVIGNIITAKADKSRLSRENATVELRLTYKNGLDRYYGLLDLGAKYCVVQALAQGRYQFPDGSKHYGKTIYADPERFFTKEIMEALEDAAHQEFQYGRQSESDQ